MHGNTKLKYKNQISWKSVKWESSRSMGTTTTKSTVTFRKIANAPKKVRHSSSICKQNNAEDEPV